MLWECPECKAIVSVSEVLPPLELDAEEIIERKLLTVHVKGLDKIMRRFRLGLPFLRLGCWLADMELEVKESEDSFWADPPLLRESPEPAIPATLAELETAFEYRKYRQMEENATRIEDIQKWYAAERERLALKDSEGTEEIHGTMPLR